MPRPNQLSKPQFSELPADFQQHYQQMIDTVNTLAGHNGTIELSNHISLGGKRIQNVGSPESPTDAISHGVAESKYSASALRPQLESGSTQPLVSYRQVNNNSQHEKSSSWLNDLLSTPPNSNNINPIISSSGGSTTVTIPASILQMADGTKRYLPSRTDVLTNPASYSISSFTVASGVATVVLSSAPVPAFTGTTVVYITGTGQIDGTFPIASIVGPTTFTINVSSGSSGTGGTVTTGGTSYYYLNNSFDRVNLSILPSQADTPFNRLGISGDGFQLLAVVSINSSGKVQVGTAGGGTPSVVSTANAGSRF